MPSPIDWFAQPQLYECIFSSVLNALNKLGIKTIE